MGLFDEGGGGLADLASTLFGGGTDQFNLGGFDMSGLTDVATKAGGGGNWWSSFGDVAKAALPFAQIAAPVANIGLGILGASQTADMTNLAKQNAQRQAQVSKAAQGAAGPVTAFGQEELARATAGNVPTAVQAQIDQWKQGAKQLAMDQAARSGQGDSSQLTQWLAWIDQQAEAMKAQALQDEISSGLSAEGVAGGLYGAATGAGVSSSAGAAGQQQSLEGLIAASNRMLAQLNQGAA